MSKPSITRPTILLFVVMMAKADSIELLAAIDGGGESLLGINNNGTVVGESCFDGCGTSLWETQGQSIVAPNPAYVFLPFSANTTPVDLNNNDEVLVWSVPYAWGDPGGLFLPTYSIFALAGPQGAKGCLWGEHGFGGKIGEWCLVLDGAIEPISIEDGYSITSDFNLWSGDGLRTINDLGQSIRSCEGDCWDSGNNGGIAGYVDSPTSTSMDRIAEVPEPGTWALVASGLVFLAIWEKRWNMKTFKNAAQWGFIVIGCLAILTFIVLLFVPDLNIRRDF